MIDADGSGTMDVTELVQASDSDIRDAKNDYNNDSILHNIIEQSIGSSKCSSIRLFFVACI